MPKGLIAFATKFLTRKSHKSSEGVNLSKGAGNDISEGNSGNAKRPQASITPTLSLKTGL